MNKRSIAHWVFALFAALPGQAGPLLESVKLNDYANVDKLLRNGSVSPDEIAQAMGLATSLVMAEPAFDNRIIILLTTTRSLKTLKTEPIPEAKPTARELITPHESKEESKEVSSSSSSPSAGPPVRPGAHGFKVGDMIIASSGRVAKIVKIDHGTVDSQWVEGGRVISEVGTGVSNIRPLHEISSILRFDQDAGRFYILSAHLEELEAYRLTLYQWRRASRDPMDMKASHSMNQIVEQTEDAYVLDVTALLPDKAKWLLSQDVANYPGVNCYATCLFYYNIIPNLKHVTEPEFEFIANSPLYHYLGARFNQHHKPPVGSIGVVNNSHAFIYIGGDLVFHKPDAYTPWEIGRIENIPFSRGRAFRIARFYECKSIQDYLDEAKIEDSEQVRQYCKLEKEVQLLEELAQNFEKGKTPPRDFPDLGAPFYAPLKKFLTDIEMKAQTEIRLIKQETKEVGKSKPELVRTDPYIFLWSSLLARLNTLELRPLFKAMR